MARIPDGHAPKLPPDPDGLNEARAEWAAEAIAVFRKRTLTDADEVLPALLTNLMHWADRAGVNFAADLDVARSHYAEETVEPS